MGKRHVTLVDEENLGNEVRKHPCLYDRSLPSYKDRDSILAAWKSIESALGLDEGEGPKRYENLKKRYSKKKMAYKYAKALGEGGPMVEIAEKDMKQYEFLNWLNIHLRLRRPNQKKTAKQKRLEGLDLVIKHNEDVSMNDDEWSGQEGTFDEDRNLGEEIASGKQPGVETKNMTTSSRGMIPTFPITKTRMAEEQICQPAAFEGESENSVNTSRSQEDQMQSTSPTVGSSQTPNKDADDIFGMMVASELKTMKKSAKFRLKYEINNLIYKYHEWQQNQDPQPT